MTERFPIIRFATNPRRWHAVWASKGPGSLFGKVTFCGQPVDGPDTYEEDANTAVSCLSCLRSLRSRSSTDDRCAATLQAH